jgi:hypothetical protein
MQNSESLDTVLTIEYVELHHSSRMVIVSIDKVSVANCSKNHFCIRMELVVSVAARCRVGRLTTLRG